MSTFSDRALAEPTQPALIPAEVTFRDGLAPAPSVQKPTLLGTALTPREIEVISWMAEGKRDAEIAIILATSARTVHKHVQRILGKTGVGTRTGVTGWLHRRPKVSPLAPRLKAISRDMSLLLGVIERLETPVPCAELAPQVFGSIEALFPSCEMSLDEMLPDGGLRGALSFASPGQEWTERLQRNMDREHPGIAYVRAGGEAPVVQLREFFSLPQLRGTALWSENFGLLDWQDQLAVVLPTRAGVAGLAINRDRRFSQRERDLLVQLSPYIRHAYENAHRLDGLAARAAEGDVSLARQLLRWHLSRREAEVLVRVAEGRRNREIAQLLAISEPTVEKHVQRILEKLAVETRAGAAAEYWQARRL